MSRSRDELADDERLLGVLLAEVGDVGADHVQQLGHDGGDAVEVPGAAVRALQRLGERRGRATVVEKPGGIDLLGRRGEEQVGAASAASSASRASSRG